MSSQLESSSSAAAEQSLALLIERLTARLQAGEALDLAEVQQLHPEHAEQLGEVWPALQALAELDRSWQAGLTDEAGQQGPEFLGELGDFRIVRELGRGGMGVVYEAEQVSLGRRVALKVLPFAATMDPRHLQRFHNEARAAACLHHTNIVPVFGVGREQGIHFYAMQLIEGQTLAAVIAELRRGQGKDAQPSDNPPTTPYAPGAAEVAANTAARAGWTTEGSPRSKEFFRAVAQLGVQAAEALDYAHQMGVVHRDIKPGNLMVDGRGDVWVTDFGLAQLQQGEASLTLTGDLVGTLRYMSPEQALAKRVLIDHRTDVYSLGVTLYELLALRTPFAGEDRQELLRQVAFEEPIRPRRLNKAIPAELETVVLKALQKSPQDRYATAQEMADDLRNWLADRPIKARRPTLWQRAQKWLRRHPAVVRSAFLLVLLAALGCALGARLLWQEQQQTRHQKNTAEKRLAQLEKANDILGSIFRDLDPEEEKKGGPALRVQLGERLDQAARLLEGEAVGDPLTVARLQQQLGSSLHALSHYQKALPLLERSLQTRESLLSPDDPATLDSKEAVAVALIRGRAQYDRAEKLLQEVIEARTAQLGADHPETLRCEGIVAALSLYRGNYKRAETVYRRLLPRQRARLGDDHRGTLTGKSNLAAAYHHQGKYDLAEPLWQEVLRAHTAQRGPESPDALITKHNLATLYQAQQKYDKAEALLKEVLKVRTAKLGARHPDTLRSKLKLAIVYKAQRKYDRAEALLGETQQGLTARRGTEHPDTLLSKDELAGLYEAQKKYKRAEPLRKEVLEARRATLGADHPDTVRSKYNLAVLFQDQREYKEAEPLLQVVLRAWSARLGADHPDTLNCKHQLARGYSARGMVKQSVPLWEEVVRGRRKKLGVDHLATIVAATNLALNYREAGRLQDAVALLDEWLPRYFKVMPRGSEARNSAVPEFVQTYTRTGRLDKAEPLLLEWIELARQQAGPRPMTYASVLLSLGLNRLRQRKYAEAEQPLRDSIALLQKKQPKTWGIPVARSTLGGALLGQKKYADAEPLLLQAYEGLKQHKHEMPKGKPYLAETLERLVQLYDATGKKEQAAKWRKALEATRRGVQAPARRSPSK